MAICSRLSALTYACGATVGIPPKPSIPNASAFRNLTPPKNSRKSSSVARTYRVQLSDPKNMARLLELVRRCALPSHQMMAAAKGALDTSGEEMVEILAYLAENNK